MDNTLAIVLIVLAFIVGAAVMALWSDYKRMKSRLTELEQSSENRHLPYNSADEIEDALAVLNRYKRFLMEPIVYIENVEEHLKNARNNRNNKKK